MNDIINAAFELFASLFILNHCRVLLKHKSIKGVSILSTAFFFSWGVWNMYYYPSLDQNLSFYAGAIVCAANALWIGMMVYYSRKGNKNEI